MSLLLLLIDSQNLSPFVEVHPLIAAQSGPVLGSRQKRSNDGPQQDERVLAQGQRPSQQQQLLKESTRLNWWARPDSPFPGRELFWPKKWHSKFAVLLW